MVIMRRINIISLYLLVGIVLITTACIPVSIAVDKQEPDTIDYTSADSLPWSTHTGEIDGDVSTIVDGNNTFSCDLYRQFIESREDANFMYSSYSLYLALAMAYAGARSDTARQMADTLHFNMTGEKVHPALNDLSNIINESQTVNKYKNPDGSIEEVIEKFQTEIANALWGQQHYGFKTDYLAIIDKYYGSAFKERDFINQSEPVRLEINDWIAEKTRDRILDMIPRGAIGEFTRLVVTNAIYFKAQWDKEFDKESTEDNDFFLLDGSSISVPMMNNADDIFYFENADFQAVRLYYKGGFNMVIILPGEGKFKAVEKAVNGPLLKTAINNMERCRVILHIPKFSYYSEFDDVNAILAKLGMPDAFSGKADFSGMTDREVSLNKVLHKSFINVDEEGTEAIAVTAIIAMGSPAPPRIVEFTANRPFIYLIQHNDTGAILFMGRVMNPAAN
jgi:serpin B